jgi:hypothetical protein
LVVCGDDIKLCEDTIARKKYTEASLDGIQEVGLEVIGEN